MAGGGAGAPAQVRQLADTWPQGPRPPWLPECPVGQRGGAPWGLEALQSREHRARSAGRSSLRVSVSRAPLLIRTVRTKATLVAASTLIACQGPSRLQRQSRSEVLGGQDLGGGTLGTAGRPARSSVIAESRGARHPLCRLWSRTLPGPSPAVCPASEPFGSAAAEHTWSVKFHVKLIKNLKTKSCSWVAPATFQVLSGHLPRPLLRLPLPVSLSSCFSISLCPPPPG